MTSVLRESRALGLAARLRDLAPLLAPFFSPAGIAVTFKEQPLLKVYFRPKRGAAWEATRELVSVIEPEFLGPMSVLEQLLSPALSTLPDRALLFSIAQSATAETLSIKVDINARYLFQSNTEATAAIETLASEIGVSPQKYHEALALIDPAAPASLSPSHDFIGMGTGPSGPRLNIYLRDNTRPSAVPKQANRGTRTYDSAAALEGAVGYILNQQHKSGEWTDFSLPIVGASNVWVTAVVGDALFKTLCSSEAEASIHSAIATAIPWLLSKTRHSGWSFNERAQTDADSTAMSLLLLRQLGIDITPYRATLRAYAIESGEYGTFQVADYPNCWSHAHADVFPTVLRALGSYSPTAFERVLKLRDSAGAWRSYWWETDLYATLAALDYFAACSQYPEIQQTESWVLLQTGQSFGAFEKALCLQALQHFKRNRDIIEASTGLVTELLQSQLPDGSWARSAMLRVPQTDCEQPWIDGGSSAVYADSGLFTTATVCKALSVHGRLQGLDRRSS
ncbi:hypothetical protein [Acidisarcina polymorpha]|uniref:hypothetical protein n=1 Tax=Acidisarcina polymorpha TaxID=2211140 RepID=UPI0012381E04|nr:hypothetical protein [Acidisarcina polymorpha]